MTPVSKMIIFFENAYEKHPDSWHVSASYDGCFLTLQSGSYPDLVLGVCSTVSYLMDDI